MHEDEKTGIKLYSICLLSCMWNAMIEYNDSVMLGKKLHYKGEQDQMNLDLWPREKTIQVQLNR